MKYYELICSTIDSPILTDLCVSTVTPVHRSLNRDLLACHKCPKPPCPMIVLHVECLPLITFVLNTPSPDTPFLIKSKGLSKLLPLCLSPYDMSSVKLSSKFCLPLVIVC